LEFDPQFVDEWKAEDGPLWLHLNLEDPNAQSWFEEEHHLNPVVIEALLAVESRPRLTRLDDSALLAFRGVNLNEGAEPDDMVGIRFWADGNRVISTFRRSLQTGDWTKDLGRIRRGTRLPPRCENERNH
jgi:zinc transporter